jgi:hypothetical protein
MERIHFEEYKGKQILIEDYSNTTKAEFAEAVASAKTIIHQQPAESVLAVVNMSDVPIDSEIVRMVKEFTAENKPFMKAVAIVGLDSFSKILLKGIEMFSSRHFDLFMNVQQAKDWLIERE